MIDASGTGRRLLFLRGPHDPFFRHHGPFATMTEFLTLCIEGFAKGAPPHHHLVIKAHPLEDGRVPVERLLNDLGRRHGVASRIHYVRGGKLAALPNHASSAVTVNSTTAQQVLWRGLPLKDFGSAVYSKPEFVSTQPLPESFSRPGGPTAGPIATTTISCWRPPSLPAVSTRPAPSASFCGRSST